MGRLLLAINRHPFFSDRPERNTTMARILGRFLIALLLILPSSFMLAGNDGSSSMFVGAEEREETPTEDVAEGEESEDTVVESDEGPAPTEGSPPPPAKPGGSTAATEKEEEEEEVKLLKPSPDADTHILFTKPTNTEFPAGAPVRFLVGFTNKGEKDFIVESMEGSFRYPQDFSFYIQNFTNVKYAKTVEPDRQATFEYGFAPSDTFSARPFGLVINLNYKDADGNLFRDAVYNETITITEPDEGLDGETFFLYLFLAAIVVLLIVGAQQLFSTFGKKRSSKPKQYVEMGTQNKSDVDYDWIPKESLEIKKSPKTSPRQRKARKAQLAADE